jgi:hypothetical protein
MIDTKPARPTKAFAGKHDLEVQEREFLARVPDFQISSFLGAYA